MWGFGKKKEEKKVEEKPIEKKVEKKVETKSDTNDNLIYRGPMSGMSEALKKFKETGEKTGDVRE